MIIRHARRQTGYSPDVGDWIWYAALPLIVYAGLCVAGGLVAWHSTTSLFAIAASALLLLFIGIHNAWDTVTYLAVSRSRLKEKTRAKATL
jgi:hypothetical protein